MRETLSKEATALVREGRLALRPTDADKSRVLAALQHRIAAGGNGAQPNVPSPPAAPEAASAGGLPIAKIAALAASVVAAVALVMYTSDKPDDAPNDAIAPTPTVDERASVVSPTEPVPSAVDAAELPSAEVQASLPAAPKAAGNRSESDRLAEEVALLTRAQKEYHSGNLSRALASVDEHRRKFPKGAMVQERVTLRMQVLCGLGRYNEAQTEAKRLQRIVPGQPAEAVCKRRK